MMLESMPPFVVFYLAALLAVFLRGWLCNLLLLATPTITALLLFIQQTNLPITHIEFELFGLSINPYHVDRLSLIFAYIFILAAFIANVFALHVKDTSQHVAALLYAGSALGAVFAGDLLTLFLFWEMLALSSVFLIWARRKNVSIAAGFRYLIMQIISGVLLLSGVVCYYHQQHTLVFTHIELNSLAAWLIFIAFGIKCAFPLLHSYIADAYPEATPTGTVFLSVFSTKVAVYALARSFAGVEILIAIGTIMALLPILYALIVNDLRRVLVYLMLTQIGIMLVAIGIGTELAINGAAAHVFIHVIYKSLLFMAIGTVLFSVGSSKATELGGLYKYLPKTAMLCIFAVVFLLFSGLISKALVMQVAAETGHTIIWLLLLASSVGVFYALLKVPFYSFFATNNAKITCRTPPKNMLYAMYLAAFVCIYLAIFPQHLYALLPYPLVYWPYDLNHIFTHLELGFFAVLVFVIATKKGYLLQSASTNLDSDWLYRKPIKQGVLFLQHKILGVYLGSIEVGGLIIQQPKQSLLRLFGLHGTLERIPASGITITIILGFFVLILLMLLEI